MAGNTFPPEPFDKAMKVWAEFDAWWQDNPDREGEEGTVGGVPGERISVQAPTGGYQALGGSYVSVNSTPTGQPPAKWLGDLGGETLPQLPIPIASMLAELSADLVWGESPKFTLQAADSQADPGSAAGVTALQKAQDRLNEIMGSDRARAEYLRSGEYASFQGGAYLAIGWDQTYDKHVTFRAYRSDVAIPTFFLGRLIEVELWSSFSREGDIYRIFEKHSPGSITYSLWKGGYGDKGRQVNMADYPETRPYLDLRPDFDRTRLPEGGGPEVDLDVRVPTGTQRLTVVYYPNKLPNPMWDKESKLRDLGRSDYAGVIPLFRQINATFGSLIRDLELGAGRITIPAEYLTNMGPGKGAAWNAARAVYSTLNILDAEKAGSSAITVTQFDIRIDEHLGAFEGLLKIILMKVGISPSTLGLKSTSGDVTATEVVDRTSQTGRTRDKKILYAKPAASDLGLVALEVDGNVFQGEGGGVFEAIDVEFPPISQIDPQKVAQIIGLLDVAGAISLWSKVKMQNPDWNDDQIKLEIRRIVYEKGLPDPTDVDNDPNTPPTSGDTQALDPETLGPQAQAGGAGVAQL